MDQWPKSAAAIANTRELAQAMQFLHPTFRDADELLRGYLPYDQNEAIVARKRELRCRPGTGV